MTWKPNGIVLDLETTFTKIVKYGKEKATTDFGSPFNDHNIVVKVGALDLSNWKYMSYDLRRPGHKKALQNLLLDNELLIGQNIKYDALWLRRVGIKYDHMMLRDTMLREYILLCGQHKYREDDEGESVSLGLDDLAPQYGGKRKLDLIKKYWAAGINTDEIPNFILSDYLLGDVVNTAIVYNGQLKQKLLLSQNAYQKFYHDVLKVVIDMEYNGAKYNADAREEVETFLDEQLHETANNLMKLVAKVGADHPKVISGQFNINSSEQLAELVYGMRLRRNDKGKVDRVAADNWARFIERFRPWENGAQDKLDYQIAQNFEQLPYGIRLKPDVSWLSTKKWYGKKGFSAGSKVIEAVLGADAATKKQEEFLRALQAYSKAETWKSSNFAGVINGVRDDGFIHGSFNMHITTTHRFSSSEPNMQNWPREGTNPLKKLIRSRYDDGVVINADYGQLEFRVAGILSNDTLLIEDVASGFDIHSHTASIAFPNLWVQSTTALTDAEKAANKPLRQRAKTKTFEFQYGAFPKNKTDQAIFDAFYGKYTKLSAWQERVEAEVASNQEYVCPFTGVIFDFPGATFNNRGSWATKAKNYPVQSLADTVNKAALIGIWRRLKAEGIADKVKIILTVHDSNVLDAPRELLPLAARIVKEEMEGVSKIFEEYFGKTLDIPLGVDVSYGNNWYEQEEYTFSE